MHSSISADDLQVGNGGQGELYNPPIAMSSPGTSRDNTSVVDSATVQQNEQVRRELERILASSQFQSSPQCQRFLRYVMERTLEGNADIIKEQVIGIEVFGKPPSYSPSEDASVRVKAGEVRKRLRSYYSELQTKPAVSIDLPVGTYVPQFHVAEPQSPTPPVSLSPSVSRYSHWPWTVAAVLLSILVGLSAYLLMRRPVVPKPLAEFWEPVYSSKRTALVCAAPVPVFAQLRDPTKDQPTRVEDFVPITDRFVAVDDLNAVSELSEMFKSMNWPYRIRIANDVSFRDFRSTPVVLVGFSYTRWDDLNHGSRYSIDLGRRPFGILDRNQMTSWTIPVNPDAPQLTEDYAIISRIFDQDTGNILIQITGISHYGTEAATDFVTNADQLGNALAKLPSGWQKKNLQLILHVSVIANTPSTPQVVGSYIW